MSISNFFSSLGAPLKNTRWSWGAIREDGTVFLRVWQDRLIKQDGRRYMQVSHLEKHISNGEAPRAGYLERLAHIEAIRNGAKIYMVMCCAKDPAAEPREILSFDRKDLFVGGKIIQLDGDWYVELVDRVPITSIKPESIKK